MGFDKQQWAILHAAVEAVGRHVCGIYRFTHKASRAVYIGQAKDIAERIKQHVRDAGKATAKSSAWHRALALYGIQAFSVEVLERLPRDRKILSDRENHWLAVHGAGHSDQCYNTSPVSGLSPLGTTPPPVTYLRISAALTGRPRPEWVKEKISATKLTLEGRARNSAANKGRKHTPEAIASFRAAQSRPELRLLTSQRFKGKPLSPEHRAKMAVLFASPGYRQKISAGNKGKKVSTEARAKIAATLLGRKHTTERRKNQSAARKRFLATGRNPWSGRKHRPESRLKMSQSRAAYLARITTAA